MVTQSMNQSKDGTFIVELRVVVVEGQSEWRYRNWVTKCSQFSRLSVGEWKLKNITSQFFSR